MIDIIARVKNKICMGLIYAFLMPLWFYMFEEIHVGNFIIENIFRASNSGKTATVKFGYILVFTEIKR